MAETIKKIYPGNWVNQINAWAKPNQSFYDNDRASGDPRDRQQQAILYKPGFTAVQKVGITQITAKPAPGTGVLGYAVRIPSPDTRPNDKPRPDISSLFVPSGAMLYRCGFRVVSEGNQPGYPSQGPREAAPPSSSGLFGAAGSRLWLQASAATPAAAPAAAAITATGANTAALTADASGEFAPQDTSSTLLTPIVTTADLTFRLYSSAGPLGTDMLGGVYIVSEVCYLVPDEVPNLDAAHLGGSNYSGITG